MKVIKKRKTNKNEVSNEINREKDENNSIFKIRINMVSVFVSLEGKTLARKASENKGTFKFAAGRKTLIIGFRRIK